MGEGVAGAGAGCGRCGRCGQAPVQRSAPFAPLPPSPPSHTLACDYLFAGVPLVTALWHPDHDPTTSTTPATPTTELPPTAKWASRVGASAVAAGGVGLGEVLVAGDWEGGYEDRIVAVARDEGLRAQLSRTLARSRSADTPAPLFDPGRW